MTSIAAIAGVPDQKARTEQYKRLCDSLITSGSVDECKEFIEHMLDSDVPLVISRPVMLQFTSSLDKLPADRKYPVASFALDKMQAREVSFDEQRHLTRKLLAQLLEEDEDWGAAAMMLSQLDVERVSPVLSETEKVAHYVKITMLYLEDDNAVDAERSFVKANALINNVEDKDLTIKYQACYARIADSKRRFLDAAMKYYDLSQAASASTDEDITAALCSSVTCAILAPAGSHRSRILSMLYKDERASAVPQFRILEKMLMERLITPEDVKEFSSTLKEHQMALLPDGFTVPESAALQHNIRSVSNMYHNISVDQLGMLLGLPEAKVESLACDMILEGRLLGYIDQVENVIVFEGGKGLLEEWDDHIRGTCEALDKIIDVIVQPTKPAAAA